MRRSRLLLLGLMLTLVALVATLTAPPAIACVGCNCGCLLNYDYCISQCHGNSTCRANCATAYQDCRANCG